MLKWTATQHKFSESLSSANSTIRTPRLSPSKQRRKRRATITNKENIVTSTPMGPPAQKFRYSPLVLAPLTDIINLTPEPIVRTPERVVPRQYASTLPKFEEEYSPNTLLPGQVLAMRGFLPDTYIGNPRYLTTPEQPCQPNHVIKKALPKKRKLDLEFANTENTNPPPKTSAVNRSAFSSSQMGDETLDKLIDAILESAQKDEKKKSRKSFNLRRRTLIKNTTENEDSILSPSYAPAGDPASDLSFLQVEAVDDMITCETPMQNPVKKARAENDCKKYFEIGLALPSIYV